MGDSAFSAQYLQAPLPAEGAIIKAHWFKSCKVLPPARDFSMIVHSWDVANKPAQGADFSVCTIWGVTRDDKYYLIHVFRDRLAFPDLLRKARDLLQLHPPSHLLIEEAANGTALYQELEKTGAFARQLVKPQFDKEARAEAATIAFEQGRVLLPEDPPWRIPYIQELTGFPNSRHDDQVDSTTQFIRFAEARRRQEPPLAMPWGLEKTDPWIDRDFDWQRW